MSDADEMIHAMLLICEQAENSEQAREALDWLADELEREDEGEGEE